jgi:hypothetical protein
MITWSKYQKLSKQEPWLTGALELLKDPDDKRPFRRRVQESISFIAFRPFSQAHPEWHGKLEWFPMFHDSRGGGDGAIARIHPIVVYHVVNEQQYKYEHLLPSGSDTWNCTIQMAMEDCVRFAGEGGQKVIFDAIVKPFQVHLTPHDMFADCFEIYKFPSDFNFQAWVVGLQ